MVPRSLHVDSLSSDSTLVQLSLARTLTFLVNRLTSENKTQCPVGVYHCSTKILLSPSAIITVQSIYCLLQHADTLVRALPFAIMAAVGEEGPADLAASWLAEPSTLRHTATRGKMGGDRPWVLLPGLADPPSYQVPGLLRSLHAMVARLGMQVGIWLCMVSCLMAEAFILARHSRLGDA